MLSETEINELEQLIDRHSTFYVLEAIAHICAEKVSHIEENWQDRVTSKAWTRAGNKINAMSIKIEV